MKKTSTGLLEFMEAVEIAYNNDTFEHDRPVTVGPGIVRLHFTDSEDKASIPREDVNRLEELGFEWEAESQAFVSERFGRDIEG